MRPIGSRTRVLSPSLLLLLLLAIHAGAVLGRTHGTVEINADAG